MTGTTQGQGKDREKIICLNISEVSPSDSLIFVFTLTANVSFSFRGKPTTEVRDTAMFPQVFLNQIILSFFLLCSKFDFWSAEITRLM